jgi:hypothetical protein
MIVIKTSGISIPKRNTGRKRKKAKVRPAGGKGVKWDAVDPYILSRYLL